ncbi:MAG: M48 family metalloprotease, partial [Verrucomicrobiota bacterium]
SATLSPKTSRQNDPISPAGTLKSLSTFSGPNPCPPAVPRCCSVCHVVLTSQVALALILPVDESATILEPLAYHRELRDYLKTEESELWTWFSSAQAKADYNEKLRLELLKTTYRLDAQGHPELHDSLREAKARLDLDIPVTFYQAQQNPHLNALLFYMPGEAHIVFSGPVFSILTREELKSVIGHELAHYQLWTLDGGDFHIADRLLHAVASDPRAASSHQHTARTYQLYTELFADRGSWHVTQDQNPVISSLVKIETGLPQVNAASYLKQADEIFAKGNVATEGLSHPEAFIRARALSLWLEQPADAESQINSMIEGVTSLDNLDLIGQKRLTRATRRFLEVLLHPKWFQTPAVLGHARLFFHDFKPAVEIEPASTEGLLFTHDKLDQYFSFLLLDFVKADPDLEEMPLAAAFELSRKLRFDAQFEKLATRELKLKAKDLRRIKDQAAKMLVEAEVKHD